MITYESGKPKVKPQDISDLFNPINSVSLYGYEFQPLFEATSLNLDGGKQKYRSFAVESQNSGMFEVKVLTVNKQM